MKHLKSNLPETYLIAATLFYYISAAVIVNWFAVVLILLLVTLLITKNKILGVSIASLWILVNLFMVLALISEVSEFPEFNSDALQLLGVGSLFLGLNLIFSVMLLVKYGKTEIKQVGLQNN